MNYPQLLDTVNRIPSFGEFDAGVLYSFLVADAPPNSVLVEVGNFHGRGLVYMGLCAKAANKGLKIVGVDHGIGMQKGQPTADALRRNVQNAGLADTVTLINKPTEVAAQDFADGSLFAVCLDDDHTHAGVRLSINSWKPKVQTLGYLCGHDYYWHSVYEPVQELFPEAVNGPTKNFWYAKIKAH